MNTNDDFQEEDDFRDFSDLIAQSTQDLAVPMKEKFSGLITEDLIDAFDTMTNIEAAFKKMLQMSKFMLDKTKSLSQQTQKLELSQARYRSTEVQLEDQKNDLEE